MAFRLFSMLELASECHMVRHCLGSYVNMLWWVGFVPPLTNYASSQIYNVVLDWPGKCCADSRSFSQRVSWTGRSEFQFLSVPWCVAIWTGSETVPCAHRTAGKSNCGSGVWTALGPVQTTWKGSRTPSTERLR